MISTPSINELILDEVRFVIQEQINTSRKDGKLIKSCRKFLLFAAEETCLMKKVNFPLTLGSFDVDFYFYFI